MIKTVFFDLDNVIFNEDLLYFKYFEILWMLLRKRRWEWTFERIIEEREDLVRNYGDPKPHITVARKYLPERDARDYLSQIRYFTKRHRNKYIKVIPGISSVIRNLNHAYNLGIIANQSKDDYDFLTNFKITVPFKVVALSSKLNQAKPNPEIFLWALENARTDPKEAVMVGDRWDLDILPAKRLGIETVLILFDYKTKGIFPQSSREKLYFDSLEEVPIWSEKKVLKMASPTGIARNPTEILFRIQELERSSTTLIPEGFEEKVATTEKSGDANEEKSWWDILRNIMTELSDQP